MTKLLLMLILLSAITSVALGLFFNLGALANTKNNPLARNGGCPLCDSSVYSYCYQKVYHDDCCCNGPNRHQIFDFGVGKQFGGGGGGGGYGGGGGGYGGCDCRFLHANSCREHQLIASCCCDEPFRK